MTEPFDVYTDAFIVTVTPWGANVSISLREPHPHLCLPNPQIN